MAIFGDFENAIVRQNGKKWPLFKVNFKVPSHFFSMPKKAFKNSLYERNNTILKKGKNGHFNLDILKLLRL